MHLKVTTLGSCVQWPLTSSFSGLEVGLELCEGLDTFQVVVQCGCMQRGLLLRATCCSQVSTLFTKELNHVTVA